MTEGCDVGGVARAFEFGDFCGEEEGGFGGRGFFDYFERAGGAGDFFQGATGNEIFDMFGDGGDGGKIHGAHDFAITRADLVFGCVGADKVEESELLFGEFHMNILYQLNRKKSWRRFRQRKWGGKS